MLFFRHVLTPSDEKILPHGHLCKLVHYALLLHGARPDVLIGFAAPEYSYRKLLATDGFVASPGAAARSASASRLS